MLTVAATTGEITLPDGTHITTSWVMFTVLVPVPETPFASV